MSIYHAKYADYSELTDDALCILTRQGDRDAEETLVARYTRLVRQLARPYFLAGGDSDRPRPGGHDRPHLWRTGVRRREIGQLPHLCRNLYPQPLVFCGPGCRRDKHTPLNQSVPLEIPFFDSHTTLLAAPLPSQVNPEDSDHRS